MDNRDRNVVCPFYRAGTRVSKSANPVGWSKRKRSLYCQGAVSRRTTEFVSEDLRKAWADKYCKRHHGCTTCPMYHILEEEEKEGGS